MQKTIEKAIVEVFRAFYEHPKAYRVTKYISEKLTVKVSLPRYKANKNKPAPKTYGKFQGTIVIGRPNYEQRQFIKLCKKAGEKFPVKKVQLKLTK